MVVLGVGVISAAAAVVAAAVVIAIMFALVDLPSDKTKEPIAQHKTDANPPERKKETEKPIEKVVEPPMVKPQPEPIPLKPKDEVEAPVPPKPKVIEPPMGFVSLFNGKDLTGWKPHTQQPGEWRMDNGILAGKSKGAGFLFTTRGDYQDFHLRLEARFNTAWSSGVLFRYDLDYLGYEALIQDRFTGVMSVRTRSGPGNLRALMNKGNPTPEPLGEWTPMEILAEGNRLRVKINGVTTADFEDTKNNFRRGHIGLRDFNGCIEFRNIWIKELRPIAVAAVPPPPGAGAAPFPADAAFVPLFNGKDLTNWKSSKPGPGNWRVIDGVLTGAGPNMGDLYTQRDDYADFHLRPRSSHQRRGTDEHRLSLSV
jgi:hypothetical protein